MPLKLIGAGFGRTATLSLKVALEQIGFGPCYHMAEVMMNPSCAAHWIRAADGDPDWETVFSGYAATVDFPGCTFWRELSRFYPQAKVLLSVRDPGKWFESTQATIFSENAIRMLSGTPMREFLEKAAWNVFGGHIHDRDFMVAAFKQHTADVEREIPKDRLLVYEASQGWEPLCEFLDVPVPDTPFPRVNSREEMAALMASQGAPDDNAVMDLTRLQESAKTLLGRS